MLIRRIAIALLATASAVAAPVLNLAETTSNNFSGVAATYGYSFTANANLSVNALGIFDSDQDGLSEPHFVGIWDLGENLLASVLISAGTGATLVDNFRYASIAPLFLSAGQTYVIGAHYLGLQGNDALVATGTPTFDPAVTYGESRFVEDGVPTFPLNSGAPDSYFGPNFDADVVAAGVPELSQSVRLPFLATVVLLSLSRSRKSSRDGQSIRP